MSDTEDGSDGADDDGTDGADDGTDDFDKEAEREKLREQYESDQKRRQATQQMSELLLKGATMTNAHCEECGSPIFRYDGEAFCPTCAGTRDVADAEGTDADGAVQGGDATASAGEVAGGDEVAGGGERTERARESRPANGSQADVGGRKPQPDAADLSPNTRVESPDAASGPGGADRPNTGDADDEVDLEAARSRLEERASSRTPDVGRATDQRSDQGRSTDSPVRQGEVPSMAQSRASLRRAIVSLSEQAAQSDDPGRAHDLLKGAREAAEALAALEGTTGE